MLSPKQLLHVKLILMATPKVSQASLLDIMRDLGYMAQWVHPIKEQIYRDAKPYKEICLGCMDYTGKEHSYDIIDTCPDCQTLGANYYMLAHQLGLGTYGIDRRVLSQIIYQAIEGDDLDAYR